MTEINNNTNDNTYKYEYDEEEFDDYKETYNHFPLNRLHLLYQALLPLSTFFFLFCKNLC